jgi:prevent-host-death family protein
MTVTTLSSREFNQDASKAKRAAQKGPVFITDRGRPAHVLLTIEDYRKIVGQGRNIVEMLALDEEVDDEAFDAAARVGPLTRPVDFG